MINKLKLDFSKQENPFEQDGNAGLVWGNIDLHVVEPGGEIIQQIIDMVWDIKALIEWILGNEHRLYNEEFPKELDKGGESIAQVWSNYFDLCRSNDEIDDHADDILEDYSVHHNIRYGMTGTKTKNVYIGRRNGLYEVSFYDNGDLHWMYNIDLRVFVDEVKALSATYLIQ